MSSESDVKSRLKLLSDLIHDYSRQYHTLDESSISDLEYDVLFNELLQIEKENPDLIVTNSPSQRVGSKPLEGFKKIDHLVQMLSLDNAFDNNELKEFDSRVLERLSLESSIEYSCEPKLDGVAANLLYKNGILDCASTRGDGKTGEDITHNIRTIKSIPLELSTLTNYQIPDLVEIRGEVFIELSDFEEINSRSKKESLKVFANPRNAAAGSLRQLDPSITSSRPLKFFAHGLGFYTENQMPQTKHSEVLDAFSSWGLPVSPESGISNSIEEGIAFFKNIEKERNSLPYEIDGVVYKVNDLSHQTLLGKVSRAPRWAIARKFPAEIGKTIVKSIFFQVGRVGSITPVAEFEPANIGGVTITHASIHNFDEIARLDVREGDTVLIKRAGDVIPQIISVDLDKRINNSVPIVIPTQCPSCGGPLEKQESGTILRCVSGQSCEAQKVESIKHFVSRNAMNIDGLGEKIILQLVNRKKVHDSSDLFLLKKEDLLDLDGFAEKSAKNLLTSIELSKNTSLHKFIYSLGIREVGEATALNLSNAFESVGRIASASKEELLEINDIGPIAANFISEFFEDNKTKVLIKNFLEVGIILKAPLNNIDSKLNNKVIVITGSFTSISRSQLKEELIRSGVKVTSSVSTNTDYLVAGDKPGSKLSKAEELNVTIISEETILDLLG